SPRRGQGHGADSSKLGRGPVLSVEQISLRNDEDVVRARQIVRKLCQEAGFGLVDQTKMVTAASELTRNARTHGGGGVMRAETVYDGNRNGVRLEIEDQGPGIPNVSLAM